MRCSDHAVLVWKVSLGRSFPGRTGSTHGSCDATWRASASPAWKTWPELRSYLNRAEYGAAVDGYIKHFKSGRIRGNVTSRTVWANSQFQGLAADGAKAALYEVEKAGLDPVAFHHDAILLDSPSDKAEDRACKLTRI